MITHENVGERLGDTGQALGTAESGGRFVNQLSQLMRSSSLAMVIKTAQSV